MKEVIISGILVILIIGYLVLFAGIMGEALHISTKGHHDKTNYKY